MFFFLQVRYLAWGRWMWPLADQACWPVHFFFFGKWPVHFKCKGLIYSHVWRIDTVAGKGIEANSF